MGYLYSLEVPSHIVIHLKGEKSDFTMEQPSGHHLIKWLKWILASKQIKIGHQLIRDNERNLAAHLSCFCQKCCLNWIMKNIVQTQTEGHSTKELTVVSKGATQGGSGELFLDWSRQKKYDNSMSCDPPKLGPFAIRNITGTIGEVWVGSVWMGSKD